MSKLSKSYRELERIVKGFSNHRRIEILELLKKEPEFSVNEISEKLNVNFKTVSEHIRRLAECHMCTGKVTFIICWLLQFRRCLLGLASS